MPPRARPTVSSREAFSDEEEVAVPAQAAAAPPTLADLAGLLQTFGASLREEIQEVNFANRQEATELRSELAVLGQRVATSLVAPAPAPERVPARLRVCV